jgi:DNA-binding MarR family transcriptional regulator
MATIQRPNSANSSFAKQWSSSLVSFGFTQISDVFLKSYSALAPYPLTHGEAMFIIHLFQFKWNEDAPFPSYRKLASMMGLTEKSVKRYARQLERKGYLVRDKRDGRTNEFNLTGLINALEQKTLFDSKSTEPVQYEDIF